jgi:hypothetical protein
MLFLRDAYMQAFPNEQPPIDPKQIADWAYSNGLWKPTETAPREILRRKLCRAFRFEYVTDPQGREVRANFPRVEEVMTPDGPKRMTQFYPMSKASAEIARQAFALDRRVALETVKQMKLDFDSWIDNNENGETLPPLDLDFKKDLDEMGLASKYDPDPYGDADDDEE